MEETKTLANTRWFQTLLAVQKTPANTRWFQTLLVVQPLRLHTATAGGTGSIPGRRTKIPHATRCSKKTQIKTKQKDKRHEVVLGGSGPGNSQHCCTTWKSYRTHGAAETEVQVTR